MLRLCLWLSWVVENSINLVLPSFKNKLSFQDTVTLFLDQILILQYIFLYFSVLNVCAESNHQHIVRNRRLRSLLNWLCISWRGKFVSGVFIVCMITGIVRWVSRSFRRFTIFVSFIQGTTGLVSFTFLKGAWVLMQSTTNSGSIFLYVILNN